MTWADYVESLIGSDTQMTVKEKTGVDQTTVSRWKRGVTSPHDPAVVAHFAQCYGANVLDAFVAAGFLTEEEAGSPPVRRVGFAELIDADRDLSPEAKVHIKNQYGLLKAASANNRAVLLREQIERSQTLDDETRDQLLATLNGGNADNVTQTATEMAEEELREFPRLVHRDAEAGDHSDEAPVSEHADRPADLVAAHDEEGSISGEQEHPDTP